MNILIMEFYDRTASERCSYDLKYSTILVKKKPHVKHSIIDIFFRKQIVQPCFMNIIIIGTTITSRSLDILNSFDIP